MDAVFFATPGELRAWLAANHETAPDLIVGYFKKGTGLPSITWPESVDQALCFGWIEARFRANTVAWAYFCAQPPSYRRTVIHLVTSAKKSETRERRLVQLIAHCAEEQPIPQLRWGAKR